jgi:hypothetical protein
MGGVARIVAGVLLSAVPGATLCTTAAVRRVPGWALPSTGVGARPA